MKNNNLSKTGTTQQHKERDQLNNAYTCSEIDNYLFRTASESGIHEIFRFRSRAEENLKNNKKII